MCLYLSVAIPKERAGLLEKAARRGLAVEPLEVKAIRKRLGDAYALYAIVSGLCSCGMIIGEHATDATDTPEQLRRKFRKKGWSEAKVERAVASVLDHDRHQPAGPPPGLRVDVRKMLAEVAEQAGELFIIGHFYNEGFETEHFEVLAGPTLTAAELREGGVPLKEDQLLRVMARVQDRVTVTAAE